MCVESTTAGVPHSAYTLNRSGVTTMASAVPSVRGQAGEITQQYSPTAFSFSVIDSMSTSSRVISNGCMFVSVGQASACQLFW